MNEEYFEWMYDSVCTDPDGNYIPDYRELCRFLHSKDYNYILPMDGNREADGISLRYHFGWDNKISNPQIASELDIYPCSVFEMMVALCRRIENDIMADDYNYGNRTSIWFFEMLKSLGIEDQTDGYFNERYVEMSIDIFLNNEYEPDGRGGLFSLKNPYRDLREVEIWDQAMWFLNEYIEQNGE